MSGAPIPIRITEVGPRDGLQNEAGFVPTEAKEAFVRALVAAGHTDIEVTSFVRDDVIPQLRDADALCQRLGPAPEGVVYSALVPNARGMERALAAGVGKVSVFTAASERFSAQNVNATIAETLARFAPVAEMARGADVVLRGYVSCAFHCPYEGPIAPAAVKDVCARLLDLGCEELSIGDTIGAARPADVAELLDTLLDGIESDRIVLHFHDTRGMAIANVVEGLSRNIHAYDASAAGLGGCPYAPGASGNLATEDLVFLLDGWPAYAHGIDLERLRAASEAVRAHIDHPLVGRVLQAPDLPAGDGR